MRSRDHSRRPRHQLAFAGARCSAAATATRPRPACQRRPGGRPWCWDRSSRPLAARTHRNCPQDAAGRGALSGCCGARGRADRCRRPGPRRRHGTRADRRSTPTRSSWPLRRVPCQIPSAITAAEADVHPSAMMHKHTAHPTVRSGRNRGLLCSQRREEFLIIARRPAVRRGCGDLKHLPGDARRSGRSGTGESFSRGRTRTHADERALACGFSVRIEYRSSPAAPPGGQASGKAIAILGSGVPARGSCQEVRQNAGASGGKRPALSPVSEALGDD